YGEDSMTTVLTIANGKGGTSKTTSAMCIARALSGAHTVEVWDADPQATATSWAEQAEENGDPLPFTVDVTNKAMLARKPRKTTDDYLLIDTPPGDPAMIDAAINVADLVINPTSPAIIEVQRLIETAQNIPDHIPKAALVTRANKQSVVYRQAMEFLNSQDNLPVFSTAIGHRLAIQNSYGTYPELFHEYSFVTDEILGATA